MPQMSPMWWLTMMIVFSITLMMCMQMLYFNNTKKLTETKKEKSKNMNWMW
uniref:ATP synthase complex subunit 8 n=1 Tax=Warodia hoso TaxID=2893154 RepID=A0A9E6XQ95_9HEMI|nr:ATP synthase F0 subunit 8 [Warodia hoso]UGN61423.1 ATP synthase F0 subunit 8 [Warodia hoso]WRY72451.1 ATP synthase F0 subunit 8 [Warodia biguttata]